MGAPKQKWTSEEEAALRAGIIKHGLGKWSAILKDPAFNAVLRSRSNVDLKDKYRNLKDMGSSSGARQKHRVSVNTVDKEVSGATPHASGKLQQDSFITKKQIIRTGDVAVSKEPTVLPTIGSNKGPGEAGTSSGLILTQAQIDAELEEMMNMTTEEATKAAARAAAEAEAAIAEAEAAEREAEDAEAEAAAARSFAEAAPDPRVFPYIRVGRPDQHVTGAAIFKGLTHRGKPNN